MKVTTFLNTQHKKKKKNIVALTTNATSGASNNLEFHAFIVKIYL
jgi:hypothetical protein